MFFVLNEINNLTEPKVSNFHSPLFILNFYDLKLRHINAFTNSSQN